MPGRSDDEVLSPGYTVGNYRADHSIADKVDGIINLMNALDKNNEKFKSEADKLYNEGQALVQSIYGNTLKTQKRKDLNNAYAKLGLLNASSNTNNSTGNNDATQNNNIDNTTNTSNENTEENNTEQNQSNDNG